MELDPRKQPFDSLTVRDFMDAAASASPIPGGGGIAAMTGALAASMAEMALNFTAGRKKFIEVDADARRLLMEITPRRKRLQELVTADAKGYAAVAEAWKMPRETAEEKARRTAAMRAAMAGALAAPLETVRLCGEIAAMLAETLRICNPNLAADAAVAAALLPGAARAAALNVWANLPALEGAQRLKITQEVADTLSDIDRSCAAVYGKVEGDLWPKNDHGPTSR